MGSGAEMCRQAKDIIEAFAPGSRVVYGESVCLGWLIVTRQERVSGDSEWECRQEVNW